MPNSTSNKNIVENSKKQVTNVPKFNNQNNLENIESIKIEISNVFEKKNNILFEKLYVELENTDNQNLTYKNQELLESLPLIKDKILINIDDFCSFFHNHAKYQVIKERIIISNNKAKTLQTEYYDYKTLIANYYLEFISNTLFDFDKLDFMENLALEFAELIDVENKNDDAIETVRLLVTLINDLKDIIYEIIKLKTFPLIEYKYQYQIQLKFKYLHFVLEQITDYCSNYNTLLLPNGTKLRHYSGNWQKIQYYIDNYLDITSKLSYIHIFLYQLELGNFEEFISIDKEDYFKKRMLFKREEVITEFNQLGIVDSFVRHRKVRDSFSIRKAYNTLKRHFEVVLSWKDFCRFVTFGGETILLNITATGGGATLLYKVVKLLVDECIITNNEFKVNGQGKTQIMKEALNEITKTNLREKYESFEADFLKELGIPPKS